MPRIGDQGTVTYLPEDKNLFREGSDVWEALNAGAEVTINRHGFIIDIWNPTTKEVLDILGNPIGTREEPLNIGTPFVPENATNELLNEAIQKKGKSINIEMDAMLIIQKDLQLKWAELKKYNEVLDGRSEGYRKRSVKVRKGERIGVGTR